MAASPQILVVDDNPEIRKLLARYLVQQGFRVELAAIVKEVKEQLAVHSIDTLVTWAAYSSVATVTSAA